MEIHRAPQVPAHWRHALLAIGNFDGVHLGHRAMLATLVSQARARATPAIAFTFDPHPLTLVRPEAVPPALTTMSRRLELLAETGIDGVLVYPTDRALLELTADQFFHNIIRDQFAATGLVEGPNFCFGKNRQGTIERLREFCDAAGMSLEVVDALDQGDGMVSSTTVRQAILDGRIAQANDLLDSRYRIAGVVVEGERRGRTINVPTANLAQVETVLPKDGVYAGRTLVDGTWWPTATNIGPNPTFAEARRKIEAHLIGFTGDLYGRQIEFEFIARLRDTQTFAGIDALKTQLATDIAQAKTLATPT
jgi:riboflavin kinase / FMN adenylyltransferase